jgi:hypothetical protein
MLPGTKTDLKAVGHHLLDMSNTRVAAGPCIGLK